MARINPPQYFRFFFVVVALFLAGQWQTLASWWRMWNLPESYYTHGPLVPLLAGVMLWQNRERLRCCPVMRTGLGVAPMALAVPAFAVGRLLEIAPLVNLAFCLFLFGLMLALLGRQMLKILALPLLFLGNMIPFSYAVLDAATGPLQLASTALAASALRVADASIIRYGNIITGDHLPAPLALGTPCSGLHLLIAFVMVVWFLCYVLEGVWWKKTALLAACLPFSLLLNSLRVALIGLVGIRTQSEGMMQSFHDWSGYVTLALGAGVIYAAFWLLGMRRPRNLLPDLDSTPQPPIARRGRAVGAVTLGLVIAVSGVAAIPGLYAPPEAAFAQEALPSKFGNWVSRSLPIDAKTREQLQSADLWNRVFINTQTLAPSVQVFAIAAYDTGAFHDPHLCLPGSGAKIEREGTTELPAADLTGRPIEATLLHVVNTRGNRGVILHWYSQENRNFASTVRLTAFLRERKIADLRQVVLHPFSLPKIRQQVNSPSRQIIWLRFASAITDEQRDIPALMRFAEEFLAHCEGFGRPRQGLLEKPG